MNVFLVYVHPEPKSFDGVMKRRAISELTRAGHSVEVSDLYEMRFKAQADFDDFREPQDDMFLDMQLEQKHAAETGTFAQDIANEQRKLLWADALLLQFPLWWYAVPAILKGWIDRVLTYGFAYGQGNNLSGRRAMLVVTTGGPPRPFTKEKQQTISNMLDNLQRGTLHFCGMDVLPPFAVYGAASADSEQREAVLKQYAQILRALRQLPPIDYSGM